MGGVRIVCGEERKCVTNIHPIGAKQILGSSSHEIIKAVRDISKNEMTIDGFN